MKVLITSKTILGSARCVGGLREDGMSVRLLTPTGDNQPANTPFAIGGVWELQMTPRESCVPPHVEDMLVTASVHVAEQKDLAHHLRSRVQPWTGGPHQLFEGHVETTGNNRLYIRAPNIPTRSTWFWTPDIDLKLTADGKGKHYYLHPNTGISISYVGDSPPTQTIPAGALVRVSLARWWKPREADDTLEERCYVQVSGWFQ